MRLSDIDFMKLLPKFMRDDLNAQAFAYAIENQMKKVNAAIKHAQIYARIDELSEEVLDELAWQFNISEYNTTYDISVKREIVKGCMVSHYRRGTVKAVEDATVKIFGEATIMEWFDYGGEPYHFKVYTSNYSASDEMLADLERVIKETQSIRSRLEEAVIDILQGTSLNVGCKVIIMDDVSFETENIT